MYIPQLEEDGMKWIRRALLFVVLSMVVFASAAIAATPCENLASLKLQETTIPAAQSIAAGAFQPPAGSGPRGGPGAAFKDLPAFCRVATTLKPSGDSDIKIEVWLPASGWNGKFEAVGNGGSAGIIA